MALATTTLSNAVAANDTQIVVASAASVAAGRVVLIDQEIMRVGQAYSTGTTVPVLRGLDGTAVVAHKATANVTHGLPSDFAAPARGNASATTYPSTRSTIVESISATATLVLSPAGTDHRVILNGTGAITLTIPVPTKDKDGDGLLIVSNGAAAHVPTFTGGVGGAGSNYDAFTFNATGTLALQVYAANGLWAMVAGPGVAATVTNITATVG